MKRRGPGDHLYSLPTPDAFVWELQENCARPPKPPPRTTRVAHPCPFESLTFRNVIRAANACGTQSLRRAL
jgi:hypothetical protein